jgi:hypothetical protein
VQGWPEREAEEHWGWGGGQAPGMGRQRSDGQPAGVAGGGGTVALQEGDAVHFFHFSFSFSILHFLLFNWADKGAHVHVSRCSSFKCQLNAYRWAHYVRFSVNSSEIDNQCELQQISKNLMILCDSNVKSWFFGI